MKKLITVNDIKQKHNERCSVIEVDGNTLITPAAVDMAMEMNINFVSSKDEKSCNDSNEPIRKEAKGEAMENIVKDKMNTEGLNCTEELIQKIVQEVLKSIQPQNADAVRKECDPSGIRLVHGESVICERFDTGRASDKVGIKEILNIKECPNMATGFMTIDHSEFDWTLRYDELDYIVEGSMDITINGKTYTGKQGDVFYIPKDTSITFGSRDSCKFFFSTYPANWAELCGYEKK